MLRVGITRNISSQAGDDVKFSILRAFGFRSIYCFSGALLMIRIIPFADFSADRRVSHRFRFRFHFRLCHFRNLYRQRCHRHRPVPVCHRRRCRQARR